MTAYDILVRDIGAPGRRRLQRISHGFALVVAVGVLLVVYGLYAEGELAPAKWAIFGTLSGWGFLAGGLGNTLRIAALDAVIAISAGAIVALGQLSKYRALRWLSILYAEAFRSLPTLLLVLFVYFGVSDLGIKVGALWSLVLGSAAYNSAVLSNIFRSGIISLGRGQSEAAMALGLGYWASMRFVIWPQAFRRMLPSTIAQCVVLLKDSSLGFFVGYADLLRRSQIVGTFANNFLQSYLVAGAVYVLLCYGLRRLAASLGAR